MSKKTAFIVYYTNANKYSFNALTGALETERNFNDLGIYFMRNKEELLNSLTEFIEKYEKIILGISFFTT